MEDSFWKKDEKIGENTENRKGMSLKLVLQDLLPPSASSLYDYINTWSLRSHNTGSSGLQSTWLVYPDRIACPRHDKSRPRTTGLEWPCFLKPPVGGLELRPWPGFRTGHKPQLHNWTSPH